MFNPNKANLLCYILLINAVPSVKLYGQSVEIVDNEKHLGNTFSTTFINEI